MKFRLVKLEARNFVLYENLEINFESLEGNLIFIVGKNYDISGADSNCTGKTLIGDLITDLLFDKTIRSHSQSSFIGKFGKDSFSSLEIEDLFSKIRYVILKYRNNPKLGDKVVLLKIENGVAESISGKTKSDTYCIISEIFGINWNTFKNRNYYGQDDSGRFLRVSDSKKAEIIIDIQQLDSFEKAMQVSSFRVKESNNKLSIREALITHIEQKIDLTKGFLASNKKSINEQIDKLMNEKSGLDEEIILSEKFNLQIKDLDKKISVLDKDLIKAKALLKKKEKFERELNLSEKEISILQKQIKFHSVSVDDIRYEIKDKNKKISNINTLRVNKCDRCGASLNEDRKLKSLDSLNSELDLLSGKEKEVLLKIDGFKKDLSIKERMIEKDFTKRILKIKNELDEYKDIFEEKRNLEIEKAKVSMKISRIFSLIERRDNLVLEVEALKKSNELKSIKGKLSSHKKELLNVKKEIINFKKEIQKNEFAKAVYHKTMRSLFDSFLQDMNVYSNQLLSELCDNDIEVSFNSKIERKSKKVVDEINVTISVDEGESRPFKTYSGGEKGRVELVTQIALFKSSENSFPFLILDEPFTAIDKSGRERIINLLQDLSEDGNTVFVMSNKNVPVGYGQIIEASRKDGRTTLNV